MSISTEITRIQTARNTLRTKAVALGIGSALDKLDDIADEFDSIVNNGAVSVSIQEGDTYTVPAGYHNGSGTVSAVSGGGNYSLQSKGPITPTKSQQSITADQGYYGLSGVTIGAIPDAYQDVSSVTATADHVLANDLFVTSEGSLTAGTMPNNGAVSGAVTPAAPVYTVPAGYHNGSGTVTASTETKSATPTKSQQTITPTTGKFLTAVTVGAIPSEYQDVSNVDAAAGDVLSGKVIVNASGVEVTGTMANNGAVSKTLDATSNNQTYTVPVGYHNGSGTVKVVLEEKTATPSASSQNITPTSGKVLSRVTVGAIPANWGDTTGDDGVAANVLSGKKVHTIVNGVATQITGAMANNGSISGTIDGLTTTSYSIPAGYASGGSVSLTNDIEAALAAI